MRFVIFCHSILSCWNHGNAHFLRGIARELIERGHQVKVYEPVDGWSRTNLIRDHGETSLAQAAALVPGLRIFSYRSHSVDIEEALEGADVVLVHEWTDADLVNRIGSQRTAGGSFVLFFHDTHHRAITAPHEIQCFDLSGYDGVLAFGEVLREVYEAHGWGRRAFTWHEAADWPLFHPKEQREKDLDLIWIGNWGDNERDRELHEYLIGPAVKLELKTRIHGVRYPAEIVDRLGKVGIDHAGWIPNHCVPQAFARSRVTMHIPRRAYVEALPGIPTIRIFEALACGIPLVCAPWNDAENLFPRECYLHAANGNKMCCALTLLLSDDALAAELVGNGLAAIRNRHTCAHRVDELFAILHNIDCARALHVSTDEVIAA
jgi:spore maturation protein CgeB